MTRRDRRRVLVAYDIPDDRRRTRLAKALEEFGDRIQYSVFIVDASPARLVRLRTRIEDVMERSHDSVLICDLGLTHDLKPQAFITLGVRRPLTEGPAIIL